MTNCNIYRSVSLLLLLIGFFCIGIVHAQKTDSLRYPIKDRRGDPFTWKNNNPFDIKDTSYIKRSIEFDPKTKQYYIVEKIGNTYYRKPTYLTLDEFLKLQGEQDEANYWRQRSQTLTDLNQKVKRPPYQVYDKLFDRIFGLGKTDSLKKMKIDIKPQGYVDFTLGYRGQRVDNPTFPERARKNGGFDFDMDANVNVMGNIGDKLKLPISYNTLSTFDFENQLKLDYKGMDDEILKSIEAGNINFTTKSQLMSSVQSLFGIKTQLQFGRLLITGAIANERSQRQALNLQGGGLVQTINKKLDDYEENRHFLLAQYFKNNYNKAMSKLPVVNSQVQIMRVEVWVTNRTGATTEARNIVALMDLGENQPYNSSITSLTLNDLPQNGANDLYGYLTSNPANRDPAKVNSLLVAKGLKPVNDYEKTFARKLNSTEYYFNPQVGFISLYQQLQPDEVLGIAFQYTYNGKVYQVGEFSQDVTVDSSQGVQKVMFLKLLKATSQRISLPIWGLMMKNVYSLDLTRVEKEDFKLNVLYQEPSGGMKRYLPESSPTVDGKSLLTILGLDRLNSRNDPMPDGVFDFVVGYTILPDQGRIIFPVLEPFGRDLDTLAFAGMPSDVKKKYVYYQLYDSIKAIAQTYANLNRFVAQGTAKGSSTTEIYLGFNIPPGSVTVLAGGQILRENADYVIDYNTGRLQILNTAIINSGVPVNVQFENTSTFGLQQRSFLGLRADYLVNKKLTVGATMEHLRERPYYSKINYGEDPINNSMYGFDFNYRSDWPGLTRLLNKLPNYTTTTMSSINAYGEAAILQPGHSPQIGKGGSGTVYVDDFEGTTTNIDLRYPFTSWALASTPAGNGLFPEADLIDSVDYGKNRAKLSWYTIEPVLQDAANPNNPLKGNKDELSDPRVHRVYTQELFPDKTTNITDVQIPTFDMAYYPTDKGPYNFSYRPTDVTANNKLLNPKQRWGGIMRAIDQTDFETANIDYVEFWVMDPFIKNTTSTGGKLYLNLGEVSEDILKDGKRFFENGLNTPTQPAAVDSTSTWGKTPVNPIQITQAFSNDVNDRLYQDVGFDGLDDEGERRKRQTYLTDLAANFGAGSVIYQMAFSDPSGDNYKWYRDASYDANNTGILGRYKQYNNPQGNSPVATGSSQYSPAATLYPDNEDLNRDNTLNETEAYYEYEIDLRPGMDIGLTKYLVDKRAADYSSTSLPDGTKPTEYWYQFRIPIKEFTRKTGDIPDFKSIRFMRMYMTGFEDSVVLRFAKLEMIRNQWRSFTYELDTTGTYTPIPAVSPTTVKLSAVNIEENSSRQPIPYKTPPGIDRVEYLSNNGVNLLMNEQAMSLKVVSLNDGDARAVFKSMHMDMRQYGNLSMFIHAESDPLQRPLQDGELNAVIRIGQDYLNNYYEIKIPLKVTVPEGQGIATEKIWPEINNLDFSFQDLVELKLRRNSVGYAMTKIYREVQADGRTYSIMGNPNFGEVSALLMGVENNASDATTVPVSAEVWFNELRLTQIDEQGGWAAMGRADVQLADLGSFSASVNHYTQGFGALQQRANERARNDMMQFDLALNLDLGKLAPRKLGFTIPMYASINKTRLTPKYDPYNLDVKLKYQLDHTNNRDSVKKASMDLTTITTLNFTNMRFAKPTMNPKLWSLSNFDFSYSYTKFAQSSPLITKNDVVKHRGGFGYNYTVPQPKYIEPFRKMRNKSPWLAPVRDFNINPVPSMLGFRADLYRQFGTYVPRIVNTYDNKVERVDTTYDKYFSFDRYYNMRWDLTRSLNLDFTAVNNATVDEPFGKLDTKAKRDSMWRNFFKGGRNIAYQQKATIGYNIPLNKIPALNWVTAQYTYGTSYNWIAASLLAREFGNIIENGQQNTIKGEFDLTTLYNKSKWLKAASTPAMPVARPTTTQPQNRQGQNNPAARPQPQAAPKVDPFKDIPPKSEVIKGLKGKKKKEALRKWRQQKREARNMARMQRMNQPLEVSTGEKIAGGLITMVKRVTIDYSANYSSRVPGYMDSTRFLGQNWHSMQPGLDYVFGKQPDSSWLNRKAREGVIARDSTFNLMYRQNFTQTLRISANVQPVRDLTINLNLEKSFSKDYTELYKDTTGTGNSFGHLSPYAMGGFNISYIGIKTMFGSYNPNEISSTFLKFQDYRQILSNRVAGSNPYYSGGTNPDGYSKGYDRYAQDVLIPAFIAAYTGRDPEKIALMKQSNSNIRSNPFSGLKPLPNWNITYTGLSRMEGLNKIFTNFTLTHNYNGNLSMNSFTSALNFADPFHYGAPEFIDTVSGNYVPFFLVPNVTMTETFGPLIGIDVTTINLLNIKFSFRKVRQLSLSLIDYQVSETRNNEWAFGLGWRKRGLTLPFKLPGIKNVPGGNDLNVTLDVSMRDETMSNSRLDQTAAYSTGGQKIIRIAPSIDYVLNNRINLKFFFDQQKTKPYISTTSPMTTTRAGVTIRVSLAQ